MLYSPDRVYSPAEEQKRMAIFSENLKTIEMHNYLHFKGLKTYTLGVNNFADMVSYTPMYFYTVFHLCYFMSQFVLLDFYQAKAPT